MSDFSEKVFVSVDLISPRKKAMLRKGQKGLHDISYLKGVYLDYISRGSACLIQNEIDNQKLIEQFEELNKTKNVEAKDFLKRFTKENLPLIETDRHSGLFEIFSEERNEITKEDAQARIDKQILNKNSFYEMVINMGDLTYKNQIFSSEEMRVRVKNCLSEFLKKSYYRNFDGVYAIHTNTDNPHLHLLIWDENKKINVYNKEAFEKLKNNLFYAFSDKDFLTKQENMFEATKKIFEYKVDVKNEMFTSIGFSSENQSSILFNQANTLKMMYKQNKRTYQNLSDKEKKVVKNIHKELMKQNENYEKFYSYWEDKIKELSKLNFNNELLDKEFKGRLDKEIKELKQSVYNKIIKVFIDEKKTYSKIDFEEIYDKKRNLFNDNEIEYHRKRKDFQALKNYLSNFESSSLDNNMLNNIWD